MTYSLDIVLPWSPVVAAALIVIGVLLLIKVLSVLLRFIPFWG